MVSIGSKICHGLDICLAVWPGRGMWNAPPPPQEG